MTGAENKVTEFYLSRMRINSIRRKETYNHEEKSRSCPGCLSDAGFDEEIINTELLTPIGISLLSVFSSSTVLAG